MKIKSHENHFEYTYKMQKGISSIKGGVQVLRDLDYPQEIIDGTNKIINQLTI
jgi:DNA mismatch repair ATPase MutS